MASAASKAVASAAAVLLAACGPTFGSMAVTVELPAFPEAWPGASAWVVSAAWAGGECCPVEAMPGEAVELRLPRSAEAAVLCAARIGAGLTKPYGAVWPQGFGADGLLRPSAPGGWAASAAVLLYRAGYRECGLDLPRLASEVEARMADPWDLEPAAILPAALDGRLRADHLKAPPSVEITVDLRRAGLVLASESPWGAAAEAGSDGLASVSVPLGSFRRWFGGAYELAAWTPDGGDPAWILRGP